MNPYKFLTDIGANRKELSLDQQKKVRLVNILIIFWYHAFILMSILAIKFRPDYTPSLILNGCGFLWISLSLMMNHRGNRTVAAFMVVGYTLFHYVAITCYFAPERYVEFFYLVVPSISLMFFSRLIYSWIIFAVSVILFHIPFLYLHYYEKEGVLFLPPIMVFLFILNFLIVLYFRQLNAKNEQLLADEKSKVEQDKNLIETQHASLEELSRFKNRFFINLSHEIRTPLTLISGAANKLASEGTFDSTAVKRIQSNVQNITKLVDDVLDLAKIEEQKLVLNKRGGGGNELMSKMKNMFESLFAQKDIKVILQLSDPNPVILIDSVYFERALSNLAHNAYKYTPEGGQVTFGVGGKKDNVQLWIEDNGIGIPSDMQNKIFDHFEQVQNDINSSSGSGIGLSFTKHVIEQHGGRSDLDSSEGKGSKFTIQLEASNEKTEPISNVTVPEAIPEKVTTDGLLFIVDDNKEIQEYLCEVFNNFTCQTFDNGATALEALKSTTPHCIISDYMMPVMNGYELIQSMREAGYKIPTIILTARTDEQNKMEVLQLGVDDYITKPFNEVELALKVNNLIANNSERISFIAEEDKTEKAPLPMDGFLLELNKDILSNIDDNQYEVSHLADALNVSERTLHRRVKSLTGLSPKQYIIGLRMQKARELLEKGTHSTIKEIALTVGISNQSYFSELYERHFGRKP
jgi:signal transduction histidine kinase/DNA-binding response OmpR family regulator